MSLARKFLYVGSGAALSRVLGFVRDIVIAAILGTGSVADAFFVAFRLPNLFRRLLAEGALNTVFVPIYLKLRGERGADAAQIFAGQAFSTIFIGIFALVVLGEIFMTTLVHCIAPGFLIRPEQVVLTVVLSRLTLPFLGFSVTAAVLSAVLNGLDRLFMAAFAPVMVNVMLIVVLGLVLAHGFAPPEQAAICLCAGVSLAGLFQLIGGVIHLRRAGVHIGWQIPRLSPEVRQFGWVLLPAMLAGGMTQINAFVGSVIGSGADGVVSQLYYADRIYQLPLGIVSMALGQTLVTQMARLLAQGDEKGAVQTQSVALEFALFLGLPAAVALYVAANPIVSVAFEHGAFTAHATHATASALKVYALGLPAFIMAKALHPAFFAAHQMRAPMLIALAGGVLEGVFAYLTFAALSQSGIALAAALAGWFNAAGLALVLWRSNRLDVSSAALLRLLRLAVSAMIMGAVVWALDCGLAPFLQAGQGLAVKISALAGLVCGGFLVYLLTSWQFGCLKALHWRAVI